jgi:hypothetical protein
MESRQKHPQFWARVYRAGGFEPYPDYLSPTSRGWQLMQAIIRRFIASAAGTPVLIVPIPEARYLQFDLQARYQPLFESLADAKQGVHVADITTPLRQLSLEDRRKLAFDTDAHFNA